MQCLRTYDMQTANIITINTEDKNLTEILKQIIADAGLSVGDLFDDDEICDHIHEAGIPVDTLYDEDDILECGCVIDAMDELEKKVAELEEENEDYLAQVYQDGWKKGWAGEDICEGRYGTFGGCDGLDEAEAKVAELEKKVAELEAKNAELMKVVGDVERVVELERQLAEFRELN